MSEKLWVLVIVALVGTACQGRRFEPAASVSKFRLLGVSAEPPEVRPGGATTLEALTFVPDDGPISYRWEWCPFTTSASDLYACPITQEEMEEALQAAADEGIPPQLLEFPPFDLGTEPTATLPYPFLQPVLVAFCEGIQAQLAEAAEENEALAGALPTFNCDETYDVSVRLVVRNSDEPVTDEILENLVEQPKEDVIVAKKRVALWLGSENEQDANPVITAVDIRPANEDDLDILRDAGHDWVDTIDDLDEDWYRVEADEQVPILVGVQYEMRTLVDEGSIQTYSKLGAVGSDERYQEPAPESLEYDWFATAGSLRPNDSFHVVGRTDLEDVSNTVFAIPTTDTSQTFGGADGERFIESCPELDDGPDAGCEVKVWTVVRDSRRGITWVERTLFATGLVEGRIPDPSEDVAVDVD